MKATSMISVALFASATSLFASTAYAADLPIRPAYVPAPVIVQNWTGCYVGVNIGADWGRADATAVSASSSISGTNSGFIGGGQVGCDYQFAGAFVIGIRDMLAGTSLNSDATFSGGQVNGYTVSADTSWVDTLTARLGYAVMPDTLVYFQGGAAWTRTNAYVSAPGAGQVGQIGGNRNGWTIGGGIEYAFAPHWSVFLEYNYMDFGTASGTAVVNGVGYSIDLKQDAQNVLIGVNYKF